MVGRLTALRSHTLNWEFVFDCYFQTVYKYRLLHSSRSLSCFQDLSDASRITLGFTLSNYLQHPEGFTKLVPKIFIYDVIFVNIYASLLVCGKHVSYTCWKQFSYQLH